MNRKRQRKKPSNQGKPRPDSGAPKTGSSVRIAISEDEDQAFRDAMASLDGQRIPLKDRFLDENSDGNTPPSRSSHKSPGGDIRTIDLHGYTLAEAQEVVGSFISQIIANRGGEVRVRVITGKGRHSGRDGSVLASEIHRYVKARFGTFIIHIDAAPADVAINNLPIRGHFDLVLKTL